jgi:chaperonin GroES
MINQLIDAGTAQTAGGGFVAGGVSLQGKGSSAMSFEPGKYKTVNGVTGAQLRTRSGSARSRTRPRLRSSFST